MTDCAKLVLIVDDDRDVREAIAEVLMDNELEPRGAENGADALRQLRAMTDKPCLILLDVMMPVMDGRAFRGAQQLDPTLRDIPVVVLTAHADAAQTARELDANGFLKKPVGLSVLLKLISQYCAAAAGSMTG